MTAPKDLRALHVLVVGAGGIGCELLKNLCFMKVGTIEVVDMDTIAISNLHRQFLFQKQHVGQSKAFVAKKVLEALFPDVRILSHNSNIIDSVLFPLEWFGTFDIVFNCLDNLEARRYVNGVCALLRDSQLCQYGKFLIESGTEGYEGQVTVIQRGFTECFDCVAKPRQRQTFPVCTIRSTPTTLVHCIVWAKDYLFFNVFCSDFAVSNEAATTAIEAPLSDKEKEILDNIGSNDESFFKTMYHDILRSDYSIAELFATFFNRIFIDDIKRLRTLDILWKAGDRRPPETLSLSEEVISKEIGNAMHVTDFDNIAPADSPLSFFRNMAIAFKRLVSRIRESSSLFSKDPEASDNEPICDIQQRALFPCFDKDDEDMMQFVFAAASLRAMQFGIPREDMFKFKAKAGNIIPAIGTTNAIIAGMMILEAMKIVQQRVVSHAKTTYYTPGRYFSNESLNPPNPSCLTCGKRIIRLSLDLHVSKLSHLTDFLFAHGEGALFEGSRLLFDADFNNFFDVPLEQLGIHHSSILNVVYDEDSLKNTACIIAHESGRIAILEEVIAIGQEPIDRAKRPLEELHSDDECKNRSKKLKSPSIDREQEIIALVVNSVSHFESLVIVREINR